MSQKRYAFLIGANGPQSERLNSLKYAERDAERLGAALKSPPCLFTGVESITAIDQQTTLTRLEEFASRCEPSDLLIVHFSGHGVYDEQLYLVCNGTDIKNVDISAIGIKTIGK